MPRTLTVLFRRDPSRDRQCEAIRFEGYQVCWPDGRPVAVGLDAFCTHGQRLLGLMEDVCAVPARLCRLRPRRRRRRDEDYEETAPA